METKSESKHLSVKSESSKRNSHKRKGILLVAVSTSATALGQIAIKLGASSLELSIKGTLLNFWLIIGILLYLLATVFLITGLKKGNLSTLYPILGLGYIWVCILSYFIFGETISILNGLGILLIICGVGLLGVTKDG